MISTKFFLRQEAVEIFDRGISAFFELIRWIFIGMGGLQVVT